MDKQNFFDQSMDDIVFDNRNKNYGAYVIRETYQKHLLKAIGISFGLFVFGLYSPKMANAIGLFPDKPDEIISCDTFILEDIIVDNEKVIEIPKTMEQPAAPATPTERFNELEGGKTTETVIRLDELDGKQVSDQKTDGKSTDILPFTDSAIDGGNSDIGKKSVVDITYSPQFIGGEEAFDAFLKKTLEYPEAPRLNEIEGETIVIFTVNTDGSVENVKVDRTSGDKELDAAAVKALRKATFMFNPGKLHGKTVRSICRMPITFNLEDFEE